MSDLLFVAYHFAPESASGTHRSLHFARSLQAAGQRVWVITAPLPPPAVSDSSLEELFPWREQVVRVPPARSLSSTYAALRRRKRAPEDQLADPVARRSARCPWGVARLRHHLAVREDLPDAKRPWLRPAVRAGTLLGRREHVAAVFASGPPWTGLMAARRIGRRLGVPFVADFRDPWTDRSGATWGYGADWANRQAQHWEAAVLTDAAAVLFNSPLTAAAAVHSYGERLGHKTHVLLNGSDVRRREAAAPFPASPPLLLRHFGTLYGGRTLSPLLLAADELVRSGAVRAGELKIEQIGSTEQEADSPDHPPAGALPLRAIPHLPFAECVGLMQEPCILLVAQPARWNRQIPTKLYDYLATGNPVLAITPEDSATWQVARAYTRCARLDPSPTRANREALADLVQAWRSSRLEQVASVRDTACLTKAEIGGEFTKVVSGLLEGTCR